jgi:hypothetical protein
LNEINMELQTIDQAVVKGAMAPGDFAERRMELVKRRSLFEEELHRLGL